MGVMGVIRDAIGAKSSKSASNLVVPDIESLPEAERPKTIEELVSTINAQRIVFGFRQVGPDARGQQTLKSVAKALSFLPEYSIRIEGHSNLAKSEDKLSTQDQARIQKLSEDRAEACGRLLKTFGVQNEMSCVGQGALKGETKGCVRLVLSHKLTPPQVKVNQPEQEPEFNATDGGTGSIPQVDVDKPSTSIGADSEKPDATVENASEVPTTEDQVIEEKSNLEPAQQGPKLAVPEDTDSRPGHIEPEVKVAEEGEGFQMVVQPEAPAPAADPAPASNLPWYLTWPTCCSQSTVNEATIKGLSIGQVQVLPYHEGATS